MSDRCVSGPVTVTITHGMVKVAERTYAGATRARVAFSGGDAPRWFTRPLVQMMRGRTPPLLSLELEGTEA